MNKNEKIMEVLEAWTDEKTIDAWNEMCDDLGDEERHIFNICEFEDRFNGQRIDLDFIRQLNYAGFDPDDDYFREDGFGNVEESFCDIFDVVDLEELAEYIEDNEEDFNDDELEEILEEDDDEE